MKTHGIKPAPSARNRSKKSNGAVSASSSSVVEPVIQSEDKEDDSDSVDSDEELEQRVTIPEVKSAK